MACLPLVKDYKKAIMKYFSAKIWNVMEFFLSLQRIDGRTGAGRLRN